MAQPARQRQPASLHDKAADDLRFIRQAMERGALFTAVPGLGGMAMGTLGLAAAAVAARQPTPEAWLAVWLGTAIVAFTVGVAAIWRKASRAGVRLTGGLARS